MTITYYIRCLALLAKNRTYPCIRGEVPTLASTLRGIARREIRSHWLKA